MGYSGDLCDENTGGGLSLYPASGWWTWSALDIRFRGGGGVVRTISQPAPDNLETLAVTMPYLMPARLVIPLEMPSRPIHLETAQSQVPTAAIKSKPLSPSNPSPPSNPPTHHPPIGIKQHQTRLFTYPFAPHEPPPLLGPPRIDRVQRINATTKIASPCSF